MEEEARNYFLKKIVINGFTLTDKGDELVLQPRGAEYTASLTIREVEPDVWRVTGGDGKYAGYARGQKRKFFENYLATWVTESRLRSLG